MTRTREENAADLASERKIIGFRGFRPLSGTGGEVKVLVIEEDAHGQHERKLSPKRSLRVSNHSPTGFEWGYEGSGPAQLALAILLELTDDEALALRWHQDFKRVVIGRLDRDKPWTLERSHIERIVSAFAPQVSL